ncbi:acyltransferase [Acinetobacter oleivorans]|uniref:acyltransferase n=1 Tax=Acinetobacter oleivorans TaxID=1148157 RepID=UPI003F7C60C6
MWKIFTILARITSLFPFFLFHFFWRCLDIFDGKFGAVARYILIAGKLKKCGTNVYIGPFVSIESVSNLSLGNNVSIHHQCTLICLGGIKIGDNVAIAHASSLISTNHTWNDNNLPIKYNPVVCDSLEIHDDVWIGCGVRILAGVKIPKRCVVAAGAVVTKSLSDSGALYGGVPVKKIRDI